MSADRDAAVGLGCSLGDRQRRLEQAVRAFDAHPDVQILAASRWFRTPPMHGGTAKGWFLNGVIRIRTTLSAHALLDLCRELEGRAGRRRAKHWGDRTLDLDLLLVGREIIDDPRLTLPHPAIARRPFVRTPLLEVWPDAQDPKSGIPYRDHPDPDGPRAVPVGILRHTRPIL